MYKYIIFFSQNGQTKNICAKHLEQVNNQPERENHNSGHPGTQDIPVYEYTEGENQ